jgi:hypothetical protein
MVRRKPDSEKDQQPLSLVTGPLPIPTNEPAFGGKGAGFFTARYAVSGFFVPSATRTWILGRGLQKPWAARRLRASEYF